MARATGRPKSWVWVDVIHDKPSASCRCTGYPQQRIIARAFALTAVGPPNDAGNGAGPVRCGMCIADPQLENAVQPIDAEWALFVPVGKKEAQIQSIR